MALKHALGCSRSMGLQPHLRQPAARFEKASFIWLRSTHGSVFVCVTGMPSFRRFYSVAGEATGVSFKVLSEHFVSYKAALTIGGGIAGGAVAVNQWGFSIQIGRFEGQMATKAELKEVKDEIVKKLDALAAAKAP